MIDVHVHLAAFPTPSNGCLMSEPMRRKFLVKLNAFVQGLPLDDPEAANRKYVDNLKRELSASRRVDKAVVLGMDGAYDSRGELVEAHTDFLISNDYVLGVAATDPRLLPGVSIHPGRKDALDELERCAERGAALVKWLPNAQRFDPSDKRFVPFYRALAKLRMPLLSHIGFEFSLIGADQSVGDPLRLIPALEEGVTVIAAHGCSKGLFFGEPYFASMLELVRRYRNFYVDTSALTLPNRVGALLMLRRHPEVFDRLLLGTDYPILVFAYPCLMAGKVSGFLSSAGGASRFDRQARVLDALGVRLGADFAKLAAAPRGS